MTTTTARTGQTSALSAANKMAAAWLVDLITRRDFHTSELLTVCSWLYGASRLAKRLGQHEAYANLRRIRNRMDELVTLHGDGKSVLAELGALVIYCQGGDEQ